MTLQDVPKWFDIFGPEAHGATPEERAASSSARFVRSQDQMAEWTPPATGRQYTAREALEYFGADFLKQIFYEEAVVLPPSAAEPAQTGRSDVDLMLIGVVRITDLSLALRGLERELRISVNVTNYPLPEFRQKLAAHNHFLDTVMQDRKIFIKGTDDELAHAIGGRESKSPHDEQE